MSSETFKDFLNEKTKVERAGSFGYMDSFQDYPKGEKALKDIENVVKSFINDSKSFAEEEGINEMKQKELIIDEITGYLYRKFGGK